MSISEIVGRILGLENVESIERVSGSFGASWAARSPAWLFFGCLALGVVAVVFYLRWQPTRHAMARRLLALGRAAVLCLLLLMLAEPTLIVHFTSRPRPWLWVLFDGTDSMAIEDALPESERTRLAQAVELAGKPAKASRSDYVKAMVRRKQDNVLEQLGKKYRLRAFLLDRADGVRQLALSPGGEGALDPAYVASQLATDGEVTALGAGLDDMARRHVAGQLSGLVLVSDFNQNSGPPAVEAAKRLGVPIHTVGVGPTSALNVSVNLQAPLVMKKAERSNLIVTLRQEGLVQQDVAVSVYARPILDTGELGADTLPIGDRTLRLDDAIQTVDFPYVPEATGRLALFAEVDPIEGEVVVEDNKTQREVTVRDDFIRLLFVEYEPTWEWRFIKEVFHRDKLVGARGFRTFLRSADPKVRQSNDLFLSTMSPARSEFFQFDVILLGDMPAEAIGERFSGMLEEFVGEFGGGLVVLAGPRYGPAALGETPLAEMLPVVPDPSAQARTQQPFALRLTPEAAQVDFMQLGADAAENRKAWANLGELPWYQPVQRLHPLATALAEHPADFTSDGEIHQPLVAIRRYGRGEVIYLAFNETWRLRRIYGEQYYRQFWGQMIHRLGLSHALGSHKRFVARTDRQRYQADDQVLLTVEAYDENFEPLRERDVPDRRLQAELILPEQPGADTKLQPLGVTALRDGVFETRFPVFAPGEHRVRVRDPLAEEPVEVTFQVTSLSPERQRAVRNVALQQALAVGTGGKSYDLATVSALPGDIRLETRRETFQKVLPLWNSWLAFTCVVGLLLGEWLVRKWIHLP